MTDIELQRARELTQDFVDWMVRFLRGMIGPDAPTYLAARPGPPILDPAARAMLARAWVAFERDFWESRPLEKIANAPASGFTEHGLYGDQLEAKLRMVAILALRFEQMLQQTEQPVREPVGQRGWFGFGSRTASAQETRPRRSKGVIGSLKDLISGIDIFADSAFDAVGIGKALKEIKELFGISLEEDAG